METLSHVCTKKEVSGALKSLGFQTRIEHNINSGQDSYRIDVTGQKADLTVYVEIGVISTYEKMYFLYDWKNCPNHVFLHINKGAIVNPEILKKWLDYRLSVLVFFADHTGQQVTIPLPRKPETLDYSKYLN